MYILGNNNLFRGTEEYFGMVGRVTIVNSTLGKALGGAAGKSPVLSISFRPFLATVTP